jgi:hypothetical protein
MKCSIYYKSSCPVDNVIFKGKAPPTQLLLVRIAGMHEALRLLNVSIHLVAKLVVLILEVG